MELTRPLNLDTAHRRAGPRRTLGLAVLCSGMLMIVLDETIVNVSLASIQRDLGFSSTGLAWVVNAYLIAFGGFLLLSGRLGDLFGRRRMFISGLLLFTLASLLCGAASAPAMLVGARFLQGAGGAMASSVILAMIVALYPDPSEQGSAIGAFSFAAAAGGSIGLVLGGVIAQTLSWHWVFIVNVPIGITATVLATRTLDEDQATAPGAGVDALGALLATGGVMLAVWSIIGTEQHGWLSVRTFSAGALSAVCIIGFLLRQASGHHPLLPIRVLRSRSVAAGNIVLALLVGGIFSFQFLTALYLQRVLGYGPGVVGVAITPVAVGVGAMSLLGFPRLLARFGHRTLLLSGLGAVAVALALLTRLPADGRYLTDLLPSLALLGVGFGAAMPALTTLTMAGAPESDTGVASGLFNTTQQVSAALGLAIAVSAAASRTATAREHGTRLTTAVVEGYDVAFGIGTGLAAAAFLAALTLVPSARRPKWSP